MKFYGDEKDYQVGRLRLADMRDLKRSGALDIIGNPTAFDGWKVNEALAEVVAAGLRRGGSLPTITGAELLERLDCQQAEDISTAAAEVMRVSGFLTGEAASPNGTSPGPETST